MVRRLFSSAIIAGILSGLIISLVYQLTTVPLIMKAEEFETKESADARPEVFSPGNALDAIITELHLKL